MTAIDEMAWCELFNADQAPSMEEIKEYIGAGAPIWESLRFYTEKTYQVIPKMSFSKCSAQPGWNIKFQKSGKSLCTLYPMPGFFIALIVVGAKEEEEVQREVDELTPYVGELFRKTPFSCGGRWLMIEVREEGILEDIKKLMMVRVKPKK